MKLYRNNTRLVVKTVRVGYRMACILDYTSLFPLTVVPGGWTVRHKYIYIYARRSSPCQQTPGPPGLRHLQAQGLEGLLPGKRGPRKAHKLTPQVRQYLEKLSTDKPELNARQLATRVRQRFRIKVHPRTLEKALKSKAKRGRQKSP